MTTVCTPDCTPLPGVDAGEDREDAAYGYAGKVRTSRRIRWFEGTPLHKNGSSQIDHAWLIWDWNRDLAKLPFDLSPNDPRLKNGYAVCDTPLDHLRADAKTCSARRRAALRIRLASSE